MLAHLGIGVYRPNGTRVLAGSERNQHDFWLYDFEVPLLARMASRKPEAFAAYRARLSALGVHVSSSELLHTYRRVYARRGSAYLVRLLGGLGVTFDRAPRLTPLEEWLLTLDTLAPPNRAAARRLAAAGSCGANISGPALSGWGFVHGAATWAEVVQAEQVYRALNAVLLTQGVQVTLAADPSEVEEGVGGPGGRMDLRATVTLDAIQQPVPVSCGLLTGMTVPNGPVANADVRIEVPGTVAEHGTTETKGGKGYAGEPLVTDQLGQTGLVFQAREDPSGGKGKEHTASGTVLAQADVRPALAGHLDPILLQLMPPARPGIALATVKWHGGERWTGTIESDTSRTYLEGIYGGNTHCTDHWRGTLDLGVRPDGAIEGTGEARPTSRPTCYAGVGKLATLETFAVRGRATDQALTLQLVFGKGDGVVLAGWNVNTTRYAGGSPKAGGPPIAVPLIDPCTARGTVALHDTIHSGGKLDPMTALDTIALKCEEPGAS